MQQSARQKAASRAWQQKVARGEVNRAERAAHERQRAAEIRQEAAERAAERAAEQAARREVNQAMFAEASAFAFGRSVRRNVRDFDDELVSMVDFARAGREAGEVAAIGAMASPMASPRSPAPALPSSLPSPARILVSPGQGPFCGSVDGDRYRDRDGPRRASPGPVRSRIDRVPDRGRVPDATFIEHNVVLGHLFDVGAQCDLLRTHAMSIRSRV